VIDLTGKRALITGGSRGIGRGCCLTLARAGAHIAFTYRRARSEAETLVRQIESAGGWARALRADFEVAGEGAGAVEEAARVMSGLDILVNNAGIWVVENVPAARLSDEQWRRTITINLTAPFEVSRAAIPHLERGREARIVFVSSISGIQGESNHADYAASKAGIFGLARALAIELAPKRVTVNVVAPGWVETDMLRDALRKPGTTLESIAREIPDGRVANVEDVAGAVAYLASPLAGHITGQVLPVTGGEGLGD
jgi:3-oxoacyl-[acyl-carrier protein] reductase